MTGLGGQCGIGMVQFFDLYGDGRLHLIAIVRELADKGETGHIVGSYYDNYILVFENKESPGRPPQVRNPYRLKMADGRPLTLKGGAGGSVGIGTAMGCGMCFWRDGRIRAADSIVRNEEPMQSLN